MYLFSKLFKLHYNNKYMEEVGYEVIDAENYSSKKGEGFSYPQLVMSLLRKCIEAGSEEMKPGYWNTKMDKFGNPNKVYVPDTRKVFVSCVMSLRMFIARDLDAEAEEEMIAIDKEIKAVEQSFYDQEKKYWEDLAPPARKQLWNSGIYYKEDRLNSELPFLHEYLTDVVEVYRKIVITITKLIKRLDDYQEAVWGE